ncbi:phage minor structural protein [Aureococcus anophagefferens]|nr:phage minor structural protein [Aureococcus anophagefferens]
MGASASVDQVQIICSNVERAVPRTPRGSRDVKHCDRDGLTDVISRAEQDVKAFYDAAWAACAEAADDLLRETAALQAEFPGEKPPRCALPQGATVEALVTLASERAEAMHAALEQPVKESGGAYFQGPRKGTLRIKEKAEADYGGDVARVVDVERATGVYGTANDFNAAISKLRTAARGEELRILRCKDNLRGGTSGYRDVKLNVDVDGFVGELQLTFQSIKEIKDSGAHQAALAKTLPPGCCVANVYLWRGRARVRLGIDDVAAMATLRDEILLGSGFEEKLNGALPRWRHPATDEELPGLGYEARTSGDGRLFYFHVATNEAQFERPLVTGDVVPLRCDRGAFLECYAGSMMRFTKLTRHQREKLGDVRAARYALLLAPAGGGKTFVAIQRALEVLHANQMVLFASKNSALALFVVKWLVVASRTSAQRVADRVRVLVAPFERGPLEIRVEEADGRQRLAIGGRVEEAERYGLAVVDEAHHLAGDATSAMDGSGLVRSIADVPESAEVATVAPRSAAVVNHRVPGGWLEFLGRLELGGAFDEERAKRDRAETAADDVVASCAADEVGDGAREVLDAGGDGVREVPDAGGEGAVLEREEDSSAAERLAVGDGGGDVAETVERESPAAAVPKVYGVAVFPDGRRVVSGSHDKTVKVWDAATGECVMSVAVFPDGRRVVSGSKDKTVKVWDAPRRVSSVAVFPDGRRVVSGSGDGTVKVYGVAVFPDGRRVVSGSDDETVKVLSVAVFPDGRRVVSGSKDNTVKVWDAATGECVATLAGHSNWVWRGVFSAVFLVCV